jgi:hypothetical protein
MRRPSSGNACSRPAMSGNPTRRPRAGAGSGESGEFRGIDHFFGSLLRSRMRPVKRSSCHRPRHRGAGNHPKERLAVFGAGIHSWWSRTSGTRSGVEGPSAGWWLAHRLSSRTSPLRTSHPAWPVCAFTTAGHLSSQGTGTGHHRRRPREAGGSVRQAHAIGLDQLTDRLASTTRSAPAKMKVLWLPARIQPLQLAHSRHILTWGHAGCVDCQVMLQVGCPADSVSGGAQLQAPIRRGRLPGHDQGRM